MEKFYEQFITKDYGNLPTTLSILSTTFLIFGLSLLISFGLVIASPLLLIFLIFQIIITKTIVEYDYEYFEGSITISKIIKKRKRKVIATFNVENISKVYKKESYPNDLKVVKSTIKNTGLLELILVINDKNNQPIGYLLSIDDKMHNILKRGNLGLFGF